MGKQNVAPEVRESATGLVGLFTRTKNAISRLFDLEEVEVTFKQKGRKTSYTYTKVTHKQVA
jgi:hypothetical protein